MKKNISLMFNVKFILVILSFITSFSFAADLGDNLILNFKLNIQNEIERFIPEDDGASKEDFLCRKNKLLLFIKNLDNVTELIEAKLEIKLYINSNPKLPKSFSAHIENIIDSYSPEVKILEDNSAILNTLKTELIEACNGFVPKQKKAQKKKKKQVEMDSFEEFTKKRNELIKIITEFNGSKEDLIKTVELFLVHEKEGLTSVFCKYLTNLLTSYQEDSLNEEESKEILYKDVHEFYINSSQYEYIYKAFIDANAINIITKVDIINWVNQKFTDIYNNLEQGQYGYRWITLNDAQKKVISHRIIESIYIALGHYSILGNIVNPDTRILICGSFIWGERDSISDIDFVSESEAQTSSVPTLFGGRTLLVGIDAISCNAARVKLSTYIASIAINNPKLLLEYKFTNDDCKCQLEEIESLMKDFRNYIQTAPSKSFHRFLDICTQSIFYFTHMKVDNEKATKIINILKQYNDNINENREKYNSIPLNIIEKIKEINMLLGELIIGFMKNE